MRKLSVEICGGSDLIICMTVGTSLWMYFVPQKYENDKWMMEENMKKVVARGREATSPPLVPVEPLPCLTSGLPGPRRSLCLFLSFRERHFGF